MTRVAVGWPALARNVAWRCHGSAPKFVCHSIKARRRRRVDGSAKERECWMNVVLSIVQGLAAAFVGVARALQL